MDLILDEHPQSEEEVQLKRVPSDRFASAPPCVKPLVQRAVLTGVLTP
jgi:hypothetical protein